MISPPGAARREGGSVGGARNGDTVRISRLSAVTILVRRREAIS
jgi:hypothetical protein